VAVLYFDDIKRRNIKPTGKKDFENRTQKSGHQINVIKLKSEPTVH
jgi:hypothetical protein